MQTRQTTTPPASHSITICTACRHTGSDRPRTVAYQATVNVAFLCASAGLARGTS